MQLPKYNKSVKTGEIGLNIFRQIIEEQLGWRFRKTSLEDDFGIDGFVDIIDDFGHVTGKSIAVQVKSGDSYLKSKTGFGWIYKGKKSHLNYYLNHDIPVVLILVDVKNRKAYWVLCDKSKTEASGEGWKIIVPFRQELIYSSKQILANYVSPVVDYNSEMELFWRVNQLFSSYNTVYIIISREDVLKKDYSMFQDLFNRLCQNEIILDESRGKVDVSISGYDSDEREVYEIPEARDWIMDFVDNVLGWSYFLSMNKYSFFLEALRSCFSRAEIVRKAYRIDDRGLLVDQISIDMELLLKFLEMAWVDLNALSDKFSIPEDINRVVSRDLYVYLLGPFLDDE